MNNVATTQNQQEGADHVRDVRLQVLLVVESVFVVVEDVTTMVDVDTSCSSSCRGNRQLMPHIFGRACYLDLDKCYIQFSVKWWN